MARAEEPEWRTSSYTDGVQCVQVQVTEEGVNVRESKDPDGPVLSFTHGEMSAFIHGVEDGEFHDLAI